MRKREFNDFEPAAPQVEEKWGKKKKEAATAFTPSKYPENVTLAPLFSVAFSKGDVAY